HIPDAPRSPASPYPTLFRSAGVGKSVTADVALTGTVADKANYQLTSPSAGTTANIDKRSVTASIVADNKTYDGTDNASISSCSLETQTANHGVVSPDAVGSADSKRPFSVASASV